MSVKDDVCDFRSLYDGLQKCKRNTLWKDSVAGYTNNALSNIYLLKQKLDADTYEIQPYNEFIIYEPKRREIQSTKIPDRVFQRSLCDNYLTNEIRKGFVYDNGACLKGKGTEFARRRLKRHLQVHNRHFGMTGWVLKCDLKDYFGSTPHEIAKQAINKRVKDEWAKIQVGKIIDSFAHKDKPGRGIGLGSQVSQLIQLSVLDDIDHYIKEVLHIKTYVRYMDDIILIHENIDHLRACRDTIKCMVKALGLNLNKKKTHIQPLKQPIHFLGFSYRLIESGKVIVKLLPEKISHERRRLKKLVARAKAGKMTRAQVDDCYRSFKAHVSGRKTSKNRSRKRVLKRNTHNLVKKFDKFYKEIWKDDYHCKERPNR